MSAVLAPRFDILPSRTYFTAEEGLDTRQLMLERAAQYKDSKLLIVVSRDDLKQWTALANAWSEHLPYGFEVASPGNLKHCLDTDYGMVLHEVGDFSFAAYPQLSRVVDLAQAYLARVYRPEKNLGNAHHLPGERKAPPSTYLRFVNNHGLVSEGHLSALPQI